MFFISLHGVIINDALPLSFYDFFLKHATIFLCLFSITSNILNHTNLGVYFMCKDRKDVLSKISAIARQASSLNSSLKDNHKLIECMYPIFLGAIIVVIVIIMSVTPKPRVGPENAPLSYIPTSHS